MPLKIIFNCIRDPVAMRPGGEITSGQAHSLFDLWNSICGSRQKGRVLRREHREIIEMVADGEDLASANSKPPGDLAKRGAFIEGLVTEAGIDVITNHGKIRDGLAEILEVGMDCVHLVVAVCDQTKRRIGIFINANVEAFIDPGNHPGQFRQEAGEEVGVSVRAGGIPLPKADKLGIRVQMDFTLDKHEVIGFDGDTGTGQAFHEAGHLAAGINNPFGSLLLQIGNELLEVLWDGRVLEFGE